jgi:CHAT domain-containing protein
LGEMKAIDEAVAGLRKALRDPNRADVRRLARAVDDKIMRPLRPLLGATPGGTRRLLIAPDGLLNLIPFAALVDERGQYLVERYTVSYLTSGRDLLRLQLAPRGSNAPLIAANPAFGGVETLAAPAGQDSGNPQAGDQVWGQIDPTAVFFQSLPGTEREAEAIKALLPGASMLLREQATETALKQSRAPSVLHIATHGFFLRDPEAPQVETRGAPGGDQLRAPATLSKWAAKVENPLLRSGLALAGANERRSGDDDGVLTAMEAASLDLWGTRLVVLSACNTGLGEVRNWEGVYGLRRALVLAGSETQVMSLWPVLDKQTRRLMVSYYRRLLKGEGCGEALRQIQLEMLKDAKLRLPYYWASFIQAGEWANLDGRR